MKKHKENLKKQETNEQIKERLKYPRLDGDPRDAIYMAKIMLGLEPLASDEEVEAKFKELEKRKITD
ncbi:MAG: hypothetical protein K2J08_08460 [Ruminococcus sp.]|nr:hypothetical protein [Ruminococcus sp.]